MPTGVAQDRHPPGERDAQRSGSGTRVEAAEGRLLKWGSPVPDGGRWVMRAVEQEVAGVRGGRGRAIGKGEGDRSGAESLILGRDLGADLIGEQRSAGGVSDNADFKAPATVRGGSAGRMVR